MTRSTSLDLRRAISGALEPTHGRDLRRLARGSGRFQDSVTTCRKANSRPTPCAELVRSQAIDILGEDRVKEITGAGVSAVVA